ncbi:hypothetical protein PoB_000908200 [Plakobranchus ocellatus]|uniref:Uncharacterized protein n=1 Tax=Plakobranchus ocellatus TaxID=259542 RepID=A0AAV3YI73_9GAST|nr:hypothetical protein PoB_000908200 [Plakobranchus ocellatus]
MTSAIVRSNIRLVHNEVIPDFLDPPSGQGAGGGVPIRYRSVPADLMADSLFTVPPKPQETTSTSAKG